MDYGQKQSTDGSQAFFTAGVGNLAAEKNTYEAENNLDLTNDATSWAPEHDLRNIGNRAIFSPEEIQKQLNDKGILLKANSQPVIAEEAPKAYKDVDAVVKTADDAGISKLVAQMKPLGVIKG